MKEEKTLFQKGTCQVMDENKLNISSKTEEFLNILKGLPLCVVQKILKNVKQAAFNYSSL